MFSTLQTVYTALADAQSCDLFWSLYRTRVERSLLPFYDQLLQLDRHVKAPNLVTLIRDNRDGQKDEIAIYGNSREQVYYECAEKIVDILAAYDIRVSYNCVDDEALPVERELPKVTLEEFVAGHPETKLIVCQPFNAFWRAKFEEAGVPPENLYFFRGARGAQYFEPMMKPGAHEVFVDAGCLNFGSSVDFAAWCKTRFDAIYAFEPDATNMQKCKETLDGTALDQSRVHLIPKGVWSEDAVLRFAEEGTGRSKLTEDGEQSVEVTSIDSALQGGPATFIKMDVEGAELEALKGAAATIQKYRPKLAVSLYHRPVDLVELPAYILGLVPDYKLYIRQHATYPVETILYCVCDGPAAL